MLLLEARSARPRPPATVGVRRGHNGSREAAVPTFTGSLLVTRGAAEMRCGGGRTDGLRSVQTTECHSARKRNEPNATGRRGGAFNAREEAKGAGRRRLDMRDSNHKALWKRRHPWAQALRGTNTGAGEDAEKAKPVPGWWERALGRATWKTGWEIPQNVKDGNTIPSGRPTSGYLSRETEFGQTRAPRVHCSATHDSKTCKQPKCPSRGI
ncbi:uncharacterized protein LOC124252130 [Equus quagga]|uniref:uncharacterized protein LOC124252130 n=1 Tax=Equus quagga TaxID=89248 RepID=UPI001EE326E8|nr:uncharacterized protein LOC124252130 [Equus quagga]